LHNQLAKNGFECVFPDANQVPTTFVKEQVGDERAWWNASADHLVYTGVAESIAYLAGIGKEQGPFDGILGFSQASAMAALIANDLLLPDGFLIIVAGFTPTDKNFVNFTRFEGRTLHVIGEKDEIVDPSISKKFVTGDNSTTLIHDGRHILPFKSAFRNQIVAWIKESTISSL
jgi:hypothetical protein